MIAVIEKKCGSCAGAHSYTFVCFLIKSVSYSFQIEYIAEFHIHFAANGKIFRLTEQNRYVNNGYFNWIEHQLEMT